METRNQQIYKYPRTHHIEGSRLQPGDEDLDSIPFLHIAGKHLVVEEKMDGANSGISFTDSGELLLQSRGHYMTGGHRERHFNLFKSWAATHAADLYNVLGSRYVMYGEWLYAKHTVYYNQLPHYFLEFDILDTKNNTFLSTPQRNMLLKPISCVHSVKVLYEGQLDKIEDLTGCLKKSFFISEGHTEDLRQRASKQGLRTDQVLKETDPSQTMEGLYIKVEEDSIVTERYKYVRSSFLTTVMQSESHWLNRPIISNRLMHNVDLFERKV